jgi:hypothetical protein
MDDYPVPSESQAAIRVLVAENPILQPILDEQVRDNDEILPHVVMADIARFLGRLVADQHDNPAVLGEIDGIVRTLDAQLQAGADSVKNVIAVSFLEQLPSTGEPGTEIRELLTPALRKVFDEVNW